MAEQPRQAVVTGGAQGIGLAVAERLAELGHMTLVLDVDEGGLAQIGAGSTSARNIAGFRCDVSDAEAVAAAIRAIEARHGPIGILVNNAGVSPAKAGGAELIENLDPAEWRRVMGINLDGVFHCCRAALPAMKRAGWGRIVNFSSQGGRMRSRLSGAHYAASKAGMIGFTRVLAGQVGAYGITANCIAPGRIETAQSEDFALADYVSQVPVGRLGHPADIAAATAYLVSDDASFVTGAILDVNGGFHMP